VGRTGCSMSRRRRLSLMSSRTMGGMHGRNAIPIRRSRIKASSRHPRAPALLSKARARRPQSLRRSYAVLARTTAFLGGPWQVRRRVPVSTDSPKSPLRRVTEVFGNPRPAKAPRNSPITDEFGESSLLRAWPGRLRPRHVTHASDARCLSPTDA